MYRTVAAIVMASAFVVFTVSRAEAQSAEYGQHTPTSSQPGNALPQKTGLKESFDRDPLEGWEFCCQHALCTTQSGRALATRGGGHAIWVQAGVLTDFAIKFRFGYEQGQGEEPGQGEIYFRSADTPQGMEFYFLRLEPGQVVLGRRLHTRDHKYPERTLAAAPFVLSPRAWHEVIIQAEGGKIRVWIDEKGVLQVEDPQPLRSGMCGFGATVNSGPVLYDEIMLVRQQQAAGNRSADVANWP